MDFKIISSILDWSKAGLDPNIFDKDDKMLKNVKDKIINKLYNKLKEKGYMQYSEWIKAIKLVGSMTTYRYADNSDLDIHVVVDLDEFIDLEHRDMDYLKASEVLNKIKTELNKEMMLIDKTKHGVEYYFESFYKYKTVQFSFESDGSVKNLEEV